MGSLVDVSVPTDEFVLDETFQRVENLRFDALRLVSNTTGADLPLLWASGADASAVRAALDADETTATVEHVSQREDRSLFRIDWAHDDRALTDTLVTEGGVLVSAHGTVEGWNFRLLFPGRNAISTTYDACAEYDVSIDRIQSLDGDPSLVRQRLTDPQSLTLRTALEHGYYTVPREVTIEELADELGVSHQALSERFRRGHRTLVEKVLGL